MPEPAGITYSLGERYDEGLFSIDPVSGGVSFKKAPYYEAAPGEDRGNQYHLEIIANNGTDEVSHAVTLIIENIHDSPGFTSTPETLAAEEKVYAYGVDVEGDGILSVTAGTIPSWLQLYGENAVITYAGTGTGGYDNAAALSASFNGPAGIAADQEGNVYVADMWNHSIRKISVTGEVTTLAGTGFRGGADGSGTAASFNEPNDLVIDSKQNIFVTDRENDAIRKITPGGVVSYFAGYPVAGYQDGTGYEAQFDRPIHITIDADDNLYVVDQNNFRVRKITPERVVTTLAGSGVEGYKDGSSTEAEFGPLVGITSDPDGNVYVTDPHNFRVRKISTDGQVSTFAGSGTSGSADGSGTEASFIDVGSLTADRLGNIYVSEYKRIRKVTPAGVVTTLAGNGSFGVVDGDGQNASFREISNLTIDPEGNLFVSEGASNRVRKVFQTKYTLTGNPSGQAGTHNVVLNLSDGTGGTAQQAFSINVRESDEPVFTSGNSVDFEENGQGVAYIAVATDENSLTYSIVEGGDADLFNITNGEVSFKMAPDFEDPQDLNEDNEYVITIKAFDGLASARHSVTISVTNANDNDPVFTSSPVTTITEGEDYFYYLMASDADGDELSFSATQLPTWMNLEQDPGGEVTTLAGSTFGFSDGSGTQAQFRSLNSLVVGADGNLYVADPDSYRIRKVSPTGQVTTFAGTGSSGVVDGDLETASFSYPYVLETDADGNLYVLDLDNGGGRIRIISSSGQVTTLAGSGESGSVDGTGTDAVFNSPTDMVRDAVGNLYITDFYNNKIRKVTPEGVVSTFAGSGEIGQQDGPAASASFYYPSHIAIDASGRLYVNDNSSKIRRITLEGNVETFAGSGFRSFADGDAENASFNYPYGMAFTPNGDLYVADSFNNRIRVVSPSGEVTTLAGSSTSASVDGPVASATFNGPRDIIIDQLGDLYILDEGSSRLRKISGRKSILKGSPAGYPGTHDVSLQVSDVNGKSVTQAFQVTVLDTSPPVFTSELVVDFKENSSVDAYTATATDTNPNTTVTFSTGSSYDEALFEFNNGVFTFRQTPNFEQPHDSNADNSYLVEVIASDGTNSVSQLVSIRVINDLNEDPSVNMAPVFTSSPVLEVKDEDVYRYVVALEDEERERVSLRATVLPSWLSLNEKALYIVSTRAGNGEARVLDGTAAEASFADPQDVVEDSKGNLFVADGVGHVIRKISVDGVVSTFAGQRYGQAGLLDGTGTEAKFTRPVSLAIDGVDNVYVADNGAYNSNGELINTAIRKITPDGVVSTIAGAETSGDVDGTGTDARFGGPNSLALDRFGNLYFVDYGRIKKMSVDGSVSTFAGGTSGTKDGIGTAAQFQGITDITIDESGVLYVAEYSSIRKVTQDAEVSTLFSAPYGYKDGPVSEAMFKTITAIAVDRDGSLYVADQSNSRIRKISTELIVSTIAGNGEFAANDGEGPEASFYSPFSIRIAKNGHLLIADVQNLKVREIAPSYVLSGDPQGQLGEHSVTLEATDSFDGKTEQSFTIKVLETPLFTSPDLQLYEENSEEVAYTAVAGLTNPNTAITYGLGTELDESLFVINATSGEVSFVSSPDFEAPLNRDLNNKYLLQVTASGGGASTTKRITIQVTNVSDEPPTFESVPVTRIFEGDPYSYDVSVSDVSMEAVTVSATDLPTWLSIEVSEGGSISNFAGSGVAGYKNGKISDAAFYGPQTIEVDSRTGVVYVSDANNGRIRKIDKEGIISTFVGSGGSYAADGTGEGASFRSIEHMTLDDTGNLYVTSLSRVTKITPQGVVTTIAGDGIQSYKDGTGTEASFMNAYGIVIDSQRNLYVADGGSHTIRKITQEGIVTTLAGKNQRGHQDGTLSDAFFSVPFGLAIDADDNLYVSELDNPRIRKITPDGKVTTVAGDGNFSVKDGTGTAASFKSPRHIDFDKNGDLLISDDYVIRKMTPAGEVTTVFGDGISGFKDGVGRNISFGLITGIKIDKAGNILVSDAINNRIRKISGPGARLTGNSSGQVGEHDVILIARDANGSESSQTFTIKVEKTGAPVITSDPIIEIDEGERYDYMIETTHSQNLSVSVSGVGLPSWLSLEPDELAVVSSVAGTVYLGNQDGPALPDLQNNSASFARISGLASDVEGNIYVSDVGFRHLIRKVSTDGQVTTLAGVNSGFADGTGTEALFNQPNDLVVDKDGNIYVNDRFNFRIRKITPENVVSTFAGSGSIGLTDGTGTEASFGYIYGLTIDSDGNLYTAEPGNYVVRKVTPEGVVSTFAGNPGQWGHGDGTGSDVYFRQLTTIEIDNDDNLYVIDWNRIRKITPEGEVSTIAGWLSGDSDGTGTEASFDNPSDLAVDSGGNVYVVGSTNNAVRKITPDGVVTTVVKSYGYGYADGTGTDIRFQGLKNIMIDKNDNIYLADNFYRIRKLEFPILSLSGNTTGHVGRYDLTVKAEDTNGEVALQEFTLLVRDITTPVFTSGTAVNLSENMTGNAYLAEATDTNELVYSLGTENDEALFEINASSGAVTFMTSPDFENPQDANLDNTYTIEVNVSDGTNLSQQIVEISITDLDDESPIITSDGAGDTSALSIEENTTSVTTVTATDSDAMSTVTFSITGGADQAFFEMEEGALSFKSAPDFETPVDSDSDNRYEVQVTATDGINTDSQAITVTVTDSDEIRPAVVLTSESDDLIRVSSFSVTITFDEAVTDFEISDLVVVNGVADDFTGANDSYSVNISPLVDGEVTVSVPAGVAIDAANNANTASNSLSRTLEVTNEAPTGMQLNASLLEENEDIGFEVGELIVTDIDTGDSHSWSLVEGEGDADNDLFQLSANKLLTNAYLDFESKAVYTVRIRVTDAGSLGFEQAFDIDVADVNEAATALSLNESAFDENSSVSTGFSVADPDASDSHSFSLVSGDGDTDNASFMISAGGQLELIEVPDFESQSSYSVRVKAMDTGGLSLEAGLIITINDVNEAATALSLNESAFDENGSISTGFAVVDPDVSDSHSFGLVSGDGDTDNASFMISAGGQLELIEIPDFELQSSYSVRVKVTDTGGLSLEAGLIITINDVNEAPTAIMLDNQSIAENEVAGTVIGAFSTNDLDANDTHSYTLTDGDGSADNDSFEIIEGELVASSSFDFEEQNSYSIRVRSQDASGLFFEQSLVIAVSNVAEAILRLSDTPDAQMTGKGSSTTFDVTIFNDGDASLEVISITYPEGFTGATSGITVAAAQSETVTVTFSPNEVRTYTGLITVSTSVGTQTIEVAGEGTLVTGIDDGFMDKASISLYPNPANNVINVDLNALNTGSLDIQLLSPTGRVLFEVKAFRDKELRLDVSSYQNGIYLMRFKDGKTTAMKKVMIRR
ncbi:MAG: hypothetical protein Roseis2KO_39300 [Roseivirga sp.]